jgi:predicted transcriptional regulator
LEIEDFKQLLKEAGFNKKSFAEHINIPHGTIIGVQQTNHQFLSG